MKERMKKLLLVSLIALLSAGAFSWQRRHADELRQHNADLRAQLSQSEQTALERQDQSEAVRKLVEENEAALFDLETRLVAAAKSSAASAPGSSRTPTDPWSDDVPFVRLSKEHLKSLSVRTLARDTANGHHLAPPAATVLGLSPAELPAVNEAIRILCEQYLELELARAPRDPKPNRSRGHETVFALPRLDSEGAALKAAFTEALTDAIGKTRSELILHYGRDVFWRQLADFGQNAKTITLMAELDEQGRERVKAYVNFRGPNNGGYSFTLPPDDDPNAVLARALWERVQGAGK
jgi:hypothetical protein